MLLNILFLLAIRKISASPRVCLSVGLWIGRKSLLRIYSGWQDEKALKSKWYVNRRSFTPLVYLKTLVWVFSHICFRAVAFLRVCYPSPQRAYWRLKLRLLLRGRENNLRKTGSAYLEFIVLCFVIVYFKDSRSLDQFTFLQDIC